MSFVEGENFREDAGVKGEGVVSEEGGKEGDFGDYGSGERNTGWDKLGF